MSRGAPGLRHLNGALKVRVERGFYLTHGQQMTDFDFSVMSAADARGYVDRAREHAAQSGGPEVMLTPAAAPLDDVVRTSDTSVALSDLVQQISRPKAWQAGASRPVRQAVAALAMHATTEQPEIVVELPAAPKTGFFASLMNFERKAVMATSGVAILVIAVTAVLVVAGGGSDDQRASKQTSGTNMTSASSQKAVQETEQPVTDTAAAEPAAEAPQATSTPISSPQSVKQAAKPALTTPATPPAAPVPNPEPVAVPPAPVPEPEPTPVPAQTPEPPVTPPTPAPVPEPAPTPAAPTDPL